MDKDNSLIKDVYSSMKISILERISSPLAGTFILSWSIWNWKLIATMLLGNEATSVRIQTVITNYYNYDYLLLYPIYSTCFIILFYPFLSFIAFAVWEWIEPTKRRLKAHYDDKTPLTREEARRLRVSLSEERIEMNNILDSNQNSIKELKEEIETLKLELTNKNEKLDILNKLNDENNSSINQLNIGIAELQSHLANKDNELASANKELQISHNALANLHKNIELLFRKTSLSQSDKDILFRNVNDNIVLDQKVAVLADADIKVLKSLAVNGIQTVSEGDHDIDNKLVPVNILDNLIKLGFVNKENNGTYEINQIGRKFLNDLPDLS